MDPVVIYDNGVTQYTVDNISNAFPIGSNVWYIFFDDGLLALYLTGFDPQKDAAILQWYTDNNAPPTIIGAAQAPEPTETQTKTRAKNKSKT